MRFGYKCGRDATPENSRCSTFLQPLFLDTPSLRTNLLLTSDIMIADKSKPLPSLPFLHHVVWYRRRVNVWHAPHGVWAQDVVLEEQQVRHGRRTIRGEVRLRQRALYIFGRCVSIAEDARRRHKSNQSNHGDKCTLIGHVT